MSHTRLICHIPDCYVTHPFDMPHTRVICYMPKWCHTPPWYATHRRMDVLRQRAGMFWCINRKSQIKKIMLKTQNTFLNFVSLESLHVNTGMEAKTLSGQAVSDPNPVPLFVRTPSNRHSLGSGTRVALAPPLWWVWSTAIPCFFCSIDWKKQLPQRCDSAPSLHRLRTTQLTVPGRHKKWTQARLSCLPFPNHNLQQFFPVSAFCK